MISDENNLAYAESLEAADRTNARFYGLFQFPPTPFTFFAPADPRIETIMLNQSIGSWDHSAVPDNCRIWVAGCGTNQAIYTALRFPNARIIASDLSATSLATSAGRARQLGISNLEFRQESINSANFQELFDYVICTGVIHHNADPAAPVARLAGALKRDGVLELMVYNRYHRIETTAFQKAIRLLLTNAEFEQELQVARRIADGIKIDNQMAAFLRYYRECSDVEFADSLLQPVEYSYTVDSLASLSVDNGLELLTPCVNHYDKATDRVSWNMEFDDESVASIYDALPDLDRWKITNHLALELSPMLWFYLQRQDSRRERVSEHRLCEQFLDRRFVRNNARKKVYLKAEDGAYVLSTQSPEYTRIHPDDLGQEVISAISSQPGKTMRDILSQLNVETTFPTINRLRLYLTTNAYPYLISVE